MQGMVPLCGFGGVPYSAVRKAAPRNLLDNSDFRNPVNQRGQTTYTFGENGGFTIDRWRTWLTGSSLTVCDGYISTTARIFQRIEHVDMSSTYTIAVKHLDGTISCFSGSFSNEFGETQVAFCYVDNGIASVCLGTDETTRELVWAALYEGEYTAATLPEYHPKGYGAELAECQRYYYKILSYWKWLSAGICTSTTQAMIPIILPQAMRIVPTVTIQDKSLIKVRCGSAESQVPSGISWNNLTSANNGMQMTATVTGATNGNVAMLYLDNGGCIEFSADL